MSRVYASVVASAVTSIALSTEHAYADNPFKSLFYSPPQISPEGNSTDAAAQKPSEKEESRRPGNENPRTSAAGFDPEPLERGVKALREINSSPQSKKVSSDRLRLVQFVFYRFFFFHCWILQDMRFFLFGFLFVAI